LGHSRKRRRRIDTIHMIAGEIEGDGGTALAL